MQPLYAAGPPLPCPSPTDGEEGKETLGPLLALRKAGACWESRACLSGAPAVSGGLLELKSMIENVTGKNALMDYGFYGCYCGWGGRGTPKDITDW